MSKQTESYNLLENPGSRSTGYDDDDGGGGGGDTYVTGTNMLLDYMYL